jgi:1,2-diacylglycerol 3-alpha-glucosyltransferase
MNILMMTNTYTPLVGGLEKSVETFTKEYRNRGHKVVVVAPQFENSPDDEEDVIRIPAIQNINGTDFSMKLPVPGVLSEALGGFKPNIVHSHHPFLIGSTALRVAYKNNAPLVFTHHTLFEQNTHYLPAGDTDIMKRFVVTLSTGYANLADHVFAPSQSVVMMLRERGVETPIDVVPTGIDVDYYAKGDGSAIRGQFKISKDSFVIGHVGRLAQEKNLGFLAEAVAFYLKANPKAHFLVAGKGPLEESIQEIFKNEGVSERLHLIGVVQGQELVDVYHAMDIFAFASHSETQGMVLTEAMAAGTPVIGIDAPGVREVIKDKENGRLLFQEDKRVFAEALAWFFSLPPAEKDKMCAAAKKTADEFSITHCTDRALKLYESIRRRDSDRHDSDSKLGKTVRRIRAEWEMVKTFTKATTGAVLKTDMIISV